MKLTQLIAVASVALSGFALAGDSFVLSSKDLPAGKSVDNKHVFNGFGCTGQNVSPSLTWQGAPVGTKSFAVLVHDPDAPTGGSGWWHWLVLNIPANAKAIEQGAGSADGAKLPKPAVQHRTDFGSVGWGGPCPPQGNKPHRYQFTLYALKVDKLDVGADASAALVGYMVNANSIGKASFTASYGR